MYVRIVLHRYNFHALHNKLQSEEELQTALAQSTGKPTASHLAAQVASTQQAMNALQQNAVQDNPNMLVQIVVLTIDQTLLKIRQLQELQQQKDRIKATYGSAVPHILMGEMSRIDLKIQEGYAALSQLIQVSNNSIVRFNHSPAARVGHLTNIVSVKREELNARLEALKNPVPTKTTGAAAPSRSSGAGTQTGLKNSTRKETTNTAGTVPSKSQSAGTQIQNPHQEGVKNPNHRQSLSTAPSSSQSVETQNVNKQQVGTAASSRSSAPTTKHQSADPRRALPNSIPTKEQPAVPDRSQSTNVARVTSQQSNVGSDSKVREKIRAKITDSNKERRMREAAKELLVEKTRAPADSTSPPNPNTAQRKQQQPK